MALPVPLKASTHSLARPSHRWIFGLTPLCAIIVFPGAGVSRSHRPALCIHRHASKYDLRVNKKVKIILKGYPYLTCFL